MTTIAPPPPAVPPASPPPAVPPPSAPGRRRRPDAPRAARPAPLSAPRAIVAVGALSLLGLTLWCLLYVVVISHIQHARVQHELYAKFRTELAKVTAPTGGVIAPGTAVALLTIPGAHLHGEVVVEGTTSGLLRSGPGHVRTTPLPGQPGVSVIYGRSLSFGAPFAELSTLRRSAPITVTTDQGVFHYQVTDIRHAGDPWTVPAAGQSSLTLVTSAGGWTPQRVVYVDAALTGKPVPDPGGRITALSHEETLMATQTDALTLVQLVLWLQLLVVVALGLTWLSLRWTRWQVWLVAVPVVLAVLWGASNTAAQLLPNLL